MRLKFNFLYLILFFLLILKPCISQNTGKSVILTSNKPGVLEKYAAKELRRYIYLRTGSLLEIQTKDEIPKTENDLIIIGCKTSKILTKNLKKFKIPGNLEDQEYLISTQSLGKRKIMFITGGSDIGTLYGVYAFLEKIGIYFNLHGDNIPDKKIKLFLPEITERKKPLFNLRGILPFHDFPEGPDFWNLDDYKSIMTNMVKMKMNFIGLHTYMDVPYFAEPTVWVGSEKDILENGDVKYSYPSSYQNNLRESYIYSPKKTGDFIFGASSLFEDDNLGSEIMKNMQPKPKTLEQSNELFNRTGKFLGKAFNYAKNLGIKTCVGTETPLYLLDSVRKRIISQYPEKTDKEISTKIYEGIFSRIKKVQPLDYYWLWLPETWTWSGASDSTVTATKEDLLSAIEAGKNLNVPFKIATCGWVLGPPKDRAMFDKDLPKDIPFSCINREVGFAKVDSSFKKINQREKWAIPWFEDDAATANPQLWVRRIRRDALDALNYGCSGLMGIHWRVKILSPNIAALASASWDQSKWNNPQEELKKLYKLPGPIGGRFTLHHKKPIGNTEEDTIYQIQRHDLSSYSFYVPNGNYKVILKFCELIHNSPGKRVFSVYLEGSPAIQDLDIFAKAGKNNALDFTFNDVKVNDGWLDIEFKNKLDNSTIAGIVIQNENYTKKINCGGEAYKDYDKDWYIYLPDQTPISSKDFYQDWAYSEFGPEAGKYLADIFEIIDGRLPRPTDWIDGPGNIKPDNRKWAEVEKEYKFIDEIQKIRPLISSPGNLERFDYWLNNFLYMKNLARLDCIYAEFINMAEDLKKSQDSISRINIINNNLFAKRTEITAQIKEIYKYLLQIIHTPGEIGTLDNMEQHILPTLFKNIDKEFSNIPGGLPKETIIDKEYSGKTRIILPTLRSSISNNEDLNLKILVLSKSKLKRIGLFIQEIGGAGFTEIPVKHINRGVYTVKISTDIHKNKDFEYYIKAIDSDETEILFPVTAPDICQTVICN